jgi:hypothetical protein
MSAMGHLHFARRVALGVLVGNFLVLERAFEGDRIVEAAAQIQALKHSYTSGRWP